MPERYSLRIKRSAETELRELPKQDLRRVAQRIQQLDQDPHPPGREKLFGESGYRVRQGDYRILYLVDDRKKIVEIYKIGHRREVYR